MRHLLTAFETKRPEIVFEWKDTETEAEGWVVINSLRGGAAGGGTRMRPGLDRREVESLAKTMEVKFTVSGPAIGGAKSGINFDPADPRKRGVLERWFKAVMPMLRNYYGTGGDLNVDEIEEVIAITEQYGLWHPQEGVVNGHYNPSKPQKIKKIGQLRQGVVKVLEDVRFSPAPERKYTVADMITGFGVAESVRHYYNIWGGHIAGKRAIIQGWGNVAASTAYYLSRAGVKVVGIIDKAGGLVNQAGFSHSQVAGLFLGRNGNALSHPDLIPFDEINESVWDLECDIFIPAAASRLVTQSQIERLMVGGLELISAGANVPFRDQEIFLGPIGEFADENVSVIPDFVANCGMARVFAYLMESNVEITDESIFRDVSRVIKVALQKAHERSESKTNITKTCFEIALGQLVG